MSNPKIFSLAAGAPSDQDDITFTKAERDALWDLIPRAIGWGGVRNFAFDKQEHRENLLLICGDWDAAPVILLSKIRGQEGPVYFYNREGGAHISDPDFTAVIQQATEDLQNFGQLTLREQSAHARDIDVSKRRSALRLVR